MVLEIDISRDLGAPAQARQAVSRLRGRLDPDVLADTRLLVSELVSNSVKYGAGSVRMRVRAIDARRVAVDVEDAGGSFDPHVRRASRFASAGLGLRLVDEIADSWGVRDDSAHVWFEIDRSAALSAVS